MSTDIAIRLPLPLGVAGALMQLIGTAWPGSVIVQQDDGLRSREMVMRIGDQDPVPVAGETARAIAESADAEGAVLEGFSPDGGLSLSNTGELNQVMAQVCVAAFADNPEAENYLEAEVHVPGDSRRYVVVYARSKGQTPHELRQAAESQLADAEAAVEALLKQGVGASFEDGVRAALTAIREAKA